MLLLLIPQFPALPPVPSSELTVALSILVPFSVLLVLVISVTVPAVMFRRRKDKVETIQDYASTAIEILAGARNPLQLPPHPPLHPPPRIPIPRQFPRQHPPQRPTHGNTSVISENSSINDRYSQTHPEDLEHHRGNQSVSINTGKQKSKSTPSQSITRTDTPSQSTTGN